MPILEVEIVDQPAAPSIAGAAQRLADAAATALGTGPGRTWVRLRRLGRGEYAENGGPLPAELAPVFVHVLEAAPPSGDELADRVAGLTRAIAEALERDASQVHVLYEPPAAGRIAFGGELRRE